VAPTASSNVSASRRPARGQAIQVLKRQNAHRIVRARHEMIGQVPPARPDIDAGDLEVSRAAIPRRFDPASSPWRFPALAIVELQHFLVAPWLR